jgi:hypothetical protein
MPFGTMLYGRNTHPPAEVGQPVDGRRNDGLACMGFPELLSDPFFHFGDRDVRVVEFTFPVAMDAIDRTFRVVFFGSHPFGTGYRHAAALATSVGFHDLLFIDDATMYAGPVLPHVTGVRLNIDPGQ